MCSRNCSDGTNIKLTAPIHCNGTVRNLYTDFRRLAALPNRVYSALGRGGVHVGQIPLNIGFVTPKDPRTRLWSELTVIRWRRATDMPAESLNPTLEKLTTEDELLKASSIQLDLNNVHPPETVRTKLSGFASSQAHMKTMNVRRGKKMKHFKKLDKIIT